MSATCRRHDTECRRLGKKTTRRHPTCGAKLATFGDVADMSPTCGAKRTAKRSLPSLMTRSFDKAVVVALNCIALIVSSSRVFPSAFFFLASNCAAKFCLSWCLRPRSDIRLIDGMPCPSWSRISLAYDQRVRTFASGRLWV